MVFYPYLLHQLRVRETRTWPRCGGGESLSPSRTGALGVCLAGHWRNLHKLQSSQKQWRGSDPAPARQFPARTEEANLGAQGEVQNHFGRTAIELLGNFQERLFAEL